MQEALFPPLVSHQRSPQPHLSCRVLPSGLTSPLGLVLPAPSPHSSPQRSAGLVFAKCRDGEKSQALPIQRKETILIEK